MRSSFPIIFRNTTTIDGCDFKRVSNFLISFFILVLCFGSKAQVVINEVNVKPGTNSISAQFQSLKDCGNPTYGNEYVELYNTSPCTPIDISCYILATPYNGMLFDSQGSFRFPTGTIIPPLGFLSVGGVNSGASIILFNFCAGPNASFLNTNNARWYLDNFDTFIALYNASGTPIDAVYWTFSTGQSNRWNNASYPGLNNAPTAIANPAACSNVATLAGPGTIPAALVSYAGVSPNIGLVLERVQDGGATWASNAAPTLNGCNGTCVVANPFFYTAAVTQPSCSLSNGAITITPNPAGAYTYTWSPNVSVSNSASNLAAGTYSFTVSAAGCQKDTTITLTASTIPSAISVTPTNPTCGLSNGSVSLGAVTGGTSPYTYNFNSLGFSGTTSYSNLAAGSYSLIVQDASGCTYTAPNIVINNTNGPTAITVTPTDATCGQSNGSVSLGTVTGGTSPYTYNFNSLGFSGTTSYPNLSAGSYTLIVQDASGCTYTAPNVVLLSTSGPSSAQISTTSAICTQTNGTISINNVVGGNAPYQYNVNNTGLSTNTTFSNFSTGIFPVQIIDNNGCVLNLTATVSNITSVGPTSAIYNFVQPECGESTGSIDIISVIGGTPPYLYNLGNTFFNTTTYYNFLSAGEYSIVIQDNNGCNYSDVASLQPGYNEEVVFAPNCFSPNDDSNNEKWFIKGYCIQDIQCNIFNRWGENIATLKSVDEKWDGTTKDNKVEIGVYVYVADITFQSGSTKRLRGRITVVR